MTGLRDLRVVKSRKMGRKRSLLKNRMGLVVKKKVKKEEKGFY